MERGNPSITYLKRTHQYNMRILYVIIVCKQQWYSSYTLTGIKHLSVISSTCFMESGNPSNTYLKRTHQYNMRILYVIIVCEQQWFRPGFNPPSVTETIIFHCLDSSFYQLPHIISTLLQVDLINIVYLTACILIGST